MRRFTFVLVCSLAGLGTVGCPLLNTGDSEQVAGRGPKNFDPYGPGSDAVRLHLSWYNGCAVVPGTGEPVGKGGVAIPNVPYPDGCSTRPERWQGPKNLPATKPLPLVAGTKYFLNQLAFNQTAYELHTDPTNMEPVVAWYRSLQPFGKLDWNNLSKNRDEWESSERSVNPRAFSHKIFFAGANWQNTGQGDTFLLEVLDSQGNVRQSITYDRTDFLLENPMGFHTVLFWESDNISPPEYPGDTRIRPPPPPPPGYPGGYPTTFKTTFKVEMMLNINPQKSFTLDPSLTGPGAMRLTWSQLPNDPFYVPVNIEDPTALPSTCYSAADPSQRVPCTFGLVPDATFSPPANGQFYTSGENIQVTVALRDANGNLLHNPDHLPSWNEYVSGESNGFMYANRYIWTDMTDRDTHSGITIHGPRHKMTPQYELNQKEWYVLPTEQFNVGVGGEGLEILTAAVVMLDIFPGGRDMHQPTRYNMPIPQNAEPGTYVILLKAHRYFRGERVTKIIPFEIPVGQTEPTSYPNRVGNCQICHRSTISLENVRHGLGVDFIEGCKNCHSRDIFVAGRTTTQNVIHKIHMNSEKYPREKNECRTCHLTRESALRATYGNCSACHPQPHGTKYEMLEFQPDFDPNTTLTIYGTCAKSCHMVKPPTQHILPEE